MWRCCGRTLEVLRPREMVPLLLRRRRQVRAPPIYERRGRGCLSHPGISPPPTAGCPLEQTRKSRVSPSSLSQYFIESAALASADVSQRCDNGKRVSGVVVKRETLPPGWAEADKQCRSPAEEGREIRACCLFSPSFILSFLHFFFQHQAFFPPYSPAACP